MPIRWLLVLLLSGVAGDAIAADQCPVLRGQQASAEVATRIAAVACDEHLRWQRPFITGDGRIASSKVWEGEGRGLQDGGAPWRRVATYWRDAGLLGSSGAAGSSDCAYAAMNPGYPGMGCRGFVIDTPWSAAFVSWVMARAGVPGFHGSGGHFDYVRAARLDPSASPYLFLDPAGVAPGVGDLLCYVRVNRVYGYGGLAAAIDGGASGLNMHCDIVAAVNPAGDAKAYLIGGNVQQAVTMRVLNLNASGHFWNLPRRSDGDVECSPDTASACDFNRQDWAVLLKLKPQAELARLGPTGPRTFLPASPAPQACCVNCVVGSGVPRCGSSGIVPRSPPVEPGDSD